MSVRRDHTIDLVTETGTIGRRESGAKLYHRGSRFGPPEQRRLDRNLVARILHLAESLDRRTRAKGQHGGVLKAKGLDVLRALLKRFYCYRTGECFPSHEAIAEAAGCCIATVGNALRRLEAAGLVETIRRKVVASFSSSVHRVRFDIAVQTSNSYVFSLPGRASSVPRSEADAKFQHETSESKKTTELEALIQAWKEAAAAANPAF